MSALNAKKTKKPADRQDFNPLPSCSFHLKAFMVVFLLILTATAVCGTVAGWLATAAIDHASENAIQSLSGSVKRLITENVKNGNHELARENIKQLMTDKRISFILVHAPKNHKVIYDAYNHPTDWHIYQSQISPQIRDKPIGLSHPLRIKTENDDVLYVMKAALIDETSTNRNIVGFLTISLHDSTQQKLLSSLYSAILSVIAVISLFAIPIVILWTNSWMKPLKKMLHGTLQLGLGQVFEPINIKRNDEIGMLAQSFNAMGANLCSIQDALVRNNELLEEKVAQRTNDLEMAKTKLEHEARDKDEFITAISHDLNAPLRNIIGMSNRLLQKYESDFTEDAVRKLKRIAANAKSESELLADLLEISRLKTDPGKDQIIDVNQLITNVTESLIDDMENKGITLKVQPHLPNLAADRIRIRQIFQNLIDNAIKYMPENNKVKEINIGVQVIDDEPTFFVQDTGRGISEKDIQRIFQLFQRARYSGHEINEDSRGVGLSSVKTIIEAYGGNIWVESELNNGSTFYFTLDPERIKPNLQQQTDNMTIK